MSGTELGTTLVNRPRNDGTSLRVEWIEGPRVNLSAVERRAATLTTRRTVKKNWQAAWLVTAITCIDLTTLSGDDTPARVARLCAKAKRPVRRDLVEALGLDHMPSVGAVCVYPTMVRHAVEALEGSGIPVASVATGFPVGLMPLPLRLEEIRWAVSEGAREIDIVITRAHVLGQDWQALYDEVCAMREACGEAHLKAILATGDLKTLRNVHKASMVAMMAGADFIKTSTGKEEVNATLPVSLVMTRAIREYRELTGFDVGFKPAGGLKSAKHALSWLILIKPSAREFRAALIAGDEVKAADFAKGWAYAGYRMTVFSASEEAWAEENLFGGKLYFDMPKALRLAGAEVTTNPVDFAPNLVVDRELITGQNPSSDHLIAASLVEALDRFRAAA